MPWVGRVFQSKSDGDCAAICGTQASVACKALERTQLASHRGGAAAPTAAAAATPPGVATGGEACWARAASAPDRMMANVRIVLKRVMIRLINRRTLRTRQVTRTFQNKVKLKIR